MKPYSAESREEVARSEREREEERKRQENLRRTAEALAEDEPKGAKKEQRWQFVFNPEADPFWQPELRETVGGPNVAYAPVWWAEVKPKEEKHSASVGDNNDDNGSSGDAEEEIENEVGEEKELDSQSNAEAEKNAHSEVYSDARPATSVPEGDGPDLIELDFDDVFSNMKAEQSDDDTGGNVEAIYTSGTDPKVESEVRMNKPAEAVTSTDGKTARKIRQTTRNLSQSPSVKPTLSGTLPLRPNEARTRAYSDSAQNADLQSAESIYYDFSDAAASQTNHDITGDYRDLSEEKVSNAPSTDDSSNPLWYDFADFDQTNVYPYLAPFIPYFAAKLADKRGLYGRDDVQGELKGMVLETYCGWLESLRVGIPGASRSLNCPDQHECRHLGFWRKALGQEECETCCLWKPIYTLVCPGCGFKRCVRCKFGEST